MLKRIRFFKRLLVLAIVIFTFFCLNVNKCWAATLYYYDKYNVNTVWVNTSPWHYSGSFSSGSAGVTGNDSYGLNGSTNIYYLSGQSGRTPADSGTVYLLAQGGAKLLKYWYDYSDSEMVEEYKLATENSTSQERGSLIQANILGALGQYPANGIHTDGFWYVRTGFATNTPTINVSTPIPNQIFSAAGGYNTITLSGAVADQDAGDTLTVRYKIDGGSTQTVSGTITADGSNQPFTNTNINVSSYSQGNHTLNVWVEDDKGGQSTVDSIPFIIDRTEPAISLSQSPASGTWTNGSVTVTATVTDASSGVSVKRWATGSRVASYFSGGTGGNALESGDTFTVTTNGTYTVYARDGAGNETVQTISISNIDTEAPTIDLAQDPPAGTWTNGGVTVTATIADAGGSGVAAKRWASGNQAVAFFAGGAGGTALGAGDTFAVATNGTYTVYARDGAGNETVQTITVVNIDTAAPTIGVIQDPPAGTWTNGSVTVTATVADAGGSGVAAKRWASGNQAVAFFSGGTGGTALGAGDTFSVTTNGTYTVYARDGAGNETVQTITVVNIDTAAPTIGVIQDPPAGTWTNGSVTVTATVADAGGSGVAAKCWASGNQAVAFFSGGTAGNALEPGDTFTVYSNGDYTVYACDGAGNETVEVIIIANINTVPQITVNATDQAVSAMSGYNTITISGKAFDADGNNLTISAIIDGVIKSTVLSPAPMVDPGTDNWQLNWDVAADDINEGTYTNITFTVDDGVIGSNTVDYTGTITVDRTPPVTNDPIVTADSATQITVHPDSADSGTGLHTEPYQYTRDGIPLGTWMAVDFVDSGLLGNTQYSYSYSVRDMVYNESVSGSVYRHTLALDPISLRLTGYNSGYLVFDIQNDPGNGTVPEVKLDAKLQGSGISGPVVSTSDFSASFTGRSLSGLSPNTNYEIWVTARNGEGVENAPVLLYASCRTSAPPVDGVDYGPGEEPDTTLIEIPEPPSGYHYEYIIQQSPFNPPPSVGDFFGGTRIDPPVNIPASPGDYLGIALCDENGLVVKFTEIHLTENDISILDHLTCIPNPVILTCGLSEQLIVRAEYTGGSSVDVTALASYSCDNAAVAAVDAAGLVGSVAEGGANITAGYGGKSVVVPVQVVAPVAVRVYITPDITSMTVGDSRQYRAILRYNNNVEEDVTGSVIWSTDNQKLATVNTGRVTAVGEGTVYVTASHSSGQNGVVGIIISSGASGGGGGSCDGDKNSEPFVPPDIPVEDEVIDPGPPSDSGSDGSSDTGGESLIIEGESPIKENNSADVTPLISFTAPKYGTVYGRIVDSGYNPIPGIQIELRSTPRITHTNANGFYKFDNVEPGKHELFVKKDGVNIVQVGLYVNPGANNVETLLNSGDAVVEVRGEGEEVNFIISLPDLVPVNSVNSVVVESPKPNVLEMAREVATRITAVGAAGSSSFFLLSAPFRRRRKNVIIRDNSGKVLEKLGFTAKRNLVVNITRPLTSSNQLQIVFTPRLARALSKVRSSVVIMCHSKDIGIYRFTMPLKKLEAVVNGSTLQVKWIEQ